jgi:hypothetical protein
MHSQYKRKIAQQSAASTQQQNKKKGPKGSATKINGSLSLTPFE